MAARVVSSLPLYHFSGDPTIERFVPHVPRSNPLQPPAVWAIDEAHAPLYWFPRDCPRIAAYTRDDREQLWFERAFATHARRVHAIEAAWLDRMRTATLYRYELPPAPFQPWAEAAGQWIAHEPVEPLAVVRLDDLLALHTAAAIELRVVPSLWALAELAVSDDWEYSLVRMANAVPRPDVRP